MAGRPRARITTSKLVLLVVMLIFVTVAAIGTVKFIQDKVDAYSFFTFVGLPVPVTIGFYSVKAKSENLSKYGKEGGYDAGQNCGGSSDGDGDFTEDNCADARFLGTEQLGEHIL